MLIRPTIFAVCSCHFDAIHEITPFLKLVYVIWNFNSEIPIWNMSFEYFSIRQKKSAHLQVNFENKRARQTPHNSYTLWNLNRLSESVSRYKTQAMRSAALILSNAEMLRFQIIPYSDLFLNIYIQNYWVCLFMFSIFYQFNVWATSMFIPY